jgi:hypothetical protein
MSTERTSLHGKIPGKGKTHATGKATKDVVYSVGLKLNEIKSNIVNLQKFSENKWQNVKEGEDLLQINDKLRIIIEDNTGWDGMWQNRSLQYSNNSKILNDILNFSIPLKLEIKEFHKGEETLQEGYQQLTLEKSKNIRAVIEALDPEEDVDHVKGVFTGDHASGKEFIKLFNSEIRKQSPNDNCDENLAPDILKDRCRAAGGSIRADKILFYSNSNNNLYRPKSAPSNVVVVDQWREEVENNVKFITANIDFHPPPILGDNYILKISIEKKSKKRWKKVKLKEGNGYKTPEITIWRKVRLKLFIQGSSSNDTSVYNSIRWDEVKKAYSDAYIEVEYPTTPHSIASSNKHPHSQEELQKYYYIIPTDQWINYLQNHVYAGWKSTEWKEWKKKHLKRLKEDLDKYSFPTGKNGELSPPDNPKQPGDNNTSWNFLGILACEIVKDVLSKEEGRKGVKVKDGVSTTDCFYALVCRPPSQDSTVGGRFEFGKLFYVVAIGDAAGILAHELGHALFLKHGATTFLKVPQAVITKRWGGDGGDSGPFWDLHDSEDMVSCIMSYNNHHYNVEYPVNWHFCGVCLLLLRFYDEDKLIGNNIFNDVQYTLRKGGSMIIGYFKPEHAGMLKMKKKSSRILYVLYPREGVVNNLGFDYYKDVSTYARGKWRFIDPNTNQNLSSGMEVVNIRPYKLPDGKTVTGITAGEKAGKNTVYFEIPNSKIPPAQSPSITIEVVES